MWIIPNKMNIESSALLPDQVESKEELNTFCPDLEQSLMWRSKPSSLQIWWQRWKRVKWMKRLFGRILKPSMHRHFIEKYTASLEVIPANRLAWQDKERVQKTQDTFGRIYTRLLTQRSLFGDSLKMSAGTSAWDMTKFTEAYGIWATQLRREYSQRLSSERHKLEKDYSSLRLPTLSNCGTTWPTPTASEDGFYQVSPGSKIVRLQLDKAVRYWSTPTASESGNCPSEMKRNNPDLEAQVMKYWATPTARDERHPNKKAKFMDQLPNQVAHYWPTPIATEAEKAAKNSHQNSLSKIILNGRPDHNANKKNGSAPVLLNPAWVAQLMGTTLEETFFVCMEME